MTDAYDELLARAERAERERDRLATDALAALAGAGICTPEEGYVKSPHCLASNISDLMRERDEARNAVQAAHYEVSETYVQRDAARAEARAAQAHVAILREALVRAKQWALNNQPLDLAPLQDLLAAALAAADAEAREFVERIRAEARREERRKCGVEVSNLMGCDVHKWVDAALAQPAEPKEGA
jgi:hypothetical protein